EVCFVRGQQVDSQLTFLGVFATVDQLKIFPEAIELPNMQALGQTRGHQGALGRRQADAGDVQQKFLEPPVHRVGNRPSLAPDIHQTASATLPLPSKACSVFRNRARSAVESTLAGFRMITNRSRSLPMPLMKSEPMPAPKAGG